MIRILVANIRVSRDNAKFTLALLMRESIIQSYDYFRFFPFPVLPGLFF